MVGGQNSGPLLGHRGHHIMLGVHKKKTIILTTWLWVYVMLVLARCELIKLKCPEVASAPSKDSPGHVDFTSEVSTAARLAAAGLTCVSLFSGHSGLVCTTRTVRLQSVQSLGLVNA